MSSYSTYLSSAHWQETRARILERAKGTCESCQNNPAVHVHHLTYERIGREQDSDLQAVCFACHAAAHPEKSFTNNWPSLVEHECRICGHGLATGHFTKAHIYLICLRCQEPDKTRKQHRPTYHEGGVPCTRCDAVLADEYGRLQHERDKHGRRVAGRLREIRRQARAKRMKRKHDPKYSIPIKDWPR